LETAKQLFKKRLLLYLSTRDLAKGKAVVNELNDNGFQNIEAIEIDVTKPDSILAAKNIVDKQ